MLQTIPKQSYPGGKAGSGVYQKIINLMPPHKTYVEGFLGGGAIMLAKRPAAVSIGVEIDREAAAAFWRGSNVTGTSIKRCCFFDWLRFSDKHNRPDTLIYLDPPYLMSTRSYQRPIYDHEFHTEAEHAALLTAILPLPCMVMISGYDSELYNDMLAGWRKVQFTGISRGGPTVETVWLNFPEPAELHDYSFLGDTSRQRQDIRRQKDRWIARLDRMPSQKRFALLSAIEEFKSRSAAGKTTDTRAAADPPLSADGGKAAVVSSSKSAARASAKMPSPDLNR